MFSVSCSGNMQNYLCYPIIDFKNLVATTLKYNGLTQLRFFNKLTINKNISAGCFVLYGMEIFPLYDPPHLKKCVRNNLLDKDLEFDCDLSSRSTKKQPVQRKFASWQHIIDVYEIDVYGQQNRRFLKKLTERHVYSHKIKKMRVKNALQIFSNSVAGRLEALSGAPGTGKK